jgi:hypothetical protein
MAIVAGHWLDEVVAGLAASRLSHLMQDVDWLVPAVQTVHILCVAAVFTATLMPALATVGLYGREQSLAAAYARFLPTVRFGLPVLLLTGALMVVAEPDRALPNSVFQVKMLLVLAAGGLTLAGARRAQRAAPADALQRALGLGALLLWALVVVAGRFIAYSLSR